MAHINIYYTARASYISGSVSSNAFLNFELMRLVLMCVAAAFWLGKAEFKPLKPPHSISVKAESEP